MKETRSNEEIGSVIMSNTEVSEMEVDQETLGSLRHLEKGKGVEDPSNSEDEGIFVSHIPQAASRDSDAENSQKSVVAEEVDSIIPKPSEIMTNASKPQVELLDNSSDDDDDNVNQRVSVGRRKIIVFSDDEESDSPQLPVVSELSLMSEEDTVDDDVAERKKKRIIVKINSDSEDDNTEMSFRQDPPTKQSTEVAKPLYKLNSDLFDAELSDEDEQTRKLGDCYSSAKLHESDDESEERSGKGKNKKPQKHRPPSVKEKQQEVKEIHSETQRMVRESHVSLPYHRPKQRTLTEFLNRRKKTMLPTNVQSNLKMSMRNMETLRLLEEKKKEVEEFYKSDSDHEDPEDIDWVPESEPQNQEATSSEMLDIKDDMQIDIIDSKNILNLDGELPDLSQVSCTTSEMEMNRVSPLETQEIHTESKLLSLQISEEFVMNKKRPTVEFHDDKNESGILIDDPSVSEHLVIESENNTFAPVESNVDLEKGGLKNDGNPSEEEQICVAITEVKGFGEVELLPSSAEDSGVISTVPVTNEIIKIDTPKLNLLASKLPDLDLSNIIKKTPKLSVGEDEDFIDLEEAKPQNMSGVNELMDRFVRHSNTKRKPAEKKQVTLSVVSKEKDAEGAEKLVSSNVAVTLDAEDDQPAETIPGARLLLLKTALKAKIREQRERERIRRVKEKQFLETEQVIQDYNGDLPDEEAELTDQSETDYETESEPEENDIIIKDKKQKKCKYVDDEAEDDDEGEDINDAGEGDNSDENDDNCVEIEESDSNDTVNMPSLQKSAILSDDEEEEESENLRLRWEETQDVCTVAQATSSDVTSANHSNTEDIFASHNFKKGCSLEKDTSTTSMDSSFELFGSVIPGHQPGGGTRHGTGGHNIESDGDSAFLTPFIKIKSGNCDKSLKEHELSLPVEDSQDLFNTTPASALTSLSPNRLNLHLTPMEDSQFLNKESQKEIDCVPMLKLDFSNIGGSQEKDELLGFCSGKFTGKTQPTHVKNLCEDNLSSTQDINELMGLCSGQFTSIEEKRTQVIKNQEVLSNFVLHQDNQDEDHHNAEEELLELCTAKFPTQVIQEDSTSTMDEMYRPKSGLIKDSEKDEDAEPAPVIVFSSDDEGMAKRQGLVKRRKKRKRIVDFSDDEDAQDAIIFDDEENEIPRTTFTGFKDNLKGGIRADFLENEAELSGSDINSGDEEEEDTDSMEEEEGDYEQYDENELRNQVGRAHLKTVLDSDKRQIRLLQEMYLEDGELHGEGRQRKFRWKNLDETDDSERKLHSDDEEGGEEEIEDTEWRKLRFEREKFLNEQREKQQAENHETEVIKVGCRPIVRSTSLNLDSSAKREPLKSANPPVPTTAPQSRIAASNSFSMLTKRGSFLSRDKTTLARIAEITKDKGTVVGGAKQGGNFVFQQLSAEEVKKKMESTQLKRTQSLPSTKRTKLDRTLSVDASSQSPSIFRYF